jgi:hypothetical protein
MASALAPKLDTSLPSATSDLSASISAVAAFSALPNAFGVMACDEEGGCGQFGKSNRYAILATLCVCVVGGGVMGSRSVSVDRLIDRQHLSTSQ